MLIVDLPKKCDYCSIKLNDTELVELDDFKLYHPSCFVKFKNQDFLKMMLSKQRQFQRFLKVEQDQKYINVMILACIDELCEMLRETPWKPWKQQQTMNYDRFKEELVDLIHFVMNLMLIAELSVDDLYDAYHKKLNENYKRQKQKY